MGENYITFKISSNGKVNYSPDAFIQSTSYEMQKVIEEIIPKAEAFIEELLKGKLSQGGG